MPDETTKKGQTTLHTYYIPIKPGKKYEKNINGILDIADANY